ncbi:MAG: zinc ribbon domain-containing protein [Chloroflexota bacterium]
MADCSYCNKTNPPKATFCGYCGKKLFSKPRLTQNTKVIIPNQADVFSNQTLQEKKPFQSQYLLNIPQPSRTNRHNPVQRLAMIVFSPSQTIEEIKQKEVGWLKFIPWITLLLILLSNFYYVLLMDQTKLSNTLGNSIFVSYLIAFITSSVLFWLFFIIAMPLYKNGLLSNQHKCPEYIQYILAWSVIPVLFRQLVRIAFMFFTQTPINDPGLSGFFEESGMISHFGNSIFQQIDIFQIWALFILIKGTDLYNISVSKKWLIPLLLLVMITLLRSTADTVFWSINGQMSFAFLYP